MTRPQIEASVALSYPTFEHDIYPPQLGLKKTTETNSRLSYLDMEITIVDRKFTTAVFDKRDGFDFHIVNFPQQYP